MKPSLPAVIAMFLYGLNTICDMIFKGTYVGFFIVSPLTQILLGLGSLVGVLCVLEQARYMSILIGENNTNEQKTYIKKCKYSYDFFTVIYIVL